MSVLFILMLLMFSLPMIYLLVLLISSLQNPRPYQSDNPLRFAVAIPAHNEEQVIAETIYALRKVDYPSELIDIYIVADHCDDQTAFIARQLNTKVYEREIAERDGKGPALAWLFDRIFESGEKYGAFTILDADTHLDPMFFKIMSARLEAGARAVQGNHMIRNPNAGWFPALTWAMFRIDNRVQNQGRSNLGLSAKNMGDSICFKPEILKWLCWGKGLVDDYTFRQELLLKGIRIEYEPRAIGLGEAARNWKEAKIQRSRWLLGTYQANQQTARKMLAEGLRKQDLVLLDGAIQAYMPSYSTVALFIGLITCLSWLKCLTLLDWIPWVLSILSGLVIIYPFLALAFDRAPMVAFLVILTGPVYIVWRTSMAISTRFLKNGTSWVRTQRQTEKKIHGNESGLKNPDT